MSIDDIDSKLIDILKKDARTPASKIADMLGISRMTVKNRMKRLEDLGIIRQYTVLLGVKPLVPTPIQVRKVERVKTGVPGFDELCEGGLPKSTTTLISGPPGAGKTIFGLQFLYNGYKEYGEPGALIALQDSPSDLLTFAATLGMDLNTSKVAIVSPFSPEITVHERADYETMAMNFEKTVEEAITRVGAERVVIDSITIFLSRFDDTYTRRREIYLINNFLRSRGCTTIMIAEHYDQADYVLESYVAQNVIVMKYSKEGNHRKKELEILKMFATDHSRGLHPYWITKNGLKIEPLT
ncbi:MAG: ATPase domain-containing protein [Candidatus Jordarchaeaceae archaeon]